jgi:cytoskeletal protein CcmA (bactofilin family)
MFGKKKSSASPLVLSAEKFDTLIGPRCEMHGRILATDSLRLDGTVVGHIEAHSDLPITVVIGASGVVQGDVRAHRIIVAGKVTGNIHALERIELHASALVQGDIKYGSLAVEHGARVLGLLLQIDSQIPDHSEDEVRAVIRKAKA